MERMRICPKRIGIVSLALVALLQAGCTSPGTATTTTRTSPSAGATGTITTGPIQIAPTASATPTPAPISGDKAAQGAAEFCTKPSSISAQMPASIPPYPGAQLKLGQTVSGTSFFGACSGQNVESIAAFYASQLPAKGWQQVQATSIGTVRQVTGVNGAIHVVVTIEPDALAANTTEIIIVTGNQ